MYTEEAFDQLETKVQRLEEEFVTLCGIIRLCPEDRWDIVKDAADMAIIGMRGESYE